MKNKTRLLSLLLALLTLLSPTSVLAQTEAENMAALNADLVLPTPQLPLVDEPLTLTVTYPRNVKHGDFENMWYIERLAEKTGITLEIQAIEESGWDEKVGLLFSSGDYGDIFLYGLSINEASQYGMAGMLIPLEDLVAQYSPNTQTIYESFPETLRNLTADDGHIYIAPAYNNTPRDMLLQYSDWINAEWLAKLGLNMPSTLEEFYDALLAFKTEDPNGNGEADEIPWSFVYNGDGYNMVLGAFGFVNARHDVIDDQYVYVPAQENFRHYLEFMHKLYDEQLLDNDIFTMTTDDYLAKILTLNVGSTIDYNVTSEEEVLKRHLLSPLTSEYNDTPVHPGRSQEKTDSGLCITSNATEEEAIAAIKLLDYWYSQEGTFEIKCGPEYGVNGDDWGYVRTVNDDGTYSYEIIYDEEAFGGSYFDCRMYNGLGNMPFCYTQAHADVIIGANVSNQWQTTCVENAGLLQARRVGYPEGVTFTPDEQDTLALYVLMDSTVDRMVAEFITGQKELNDDTWNEYLSILDAMDLDTLVSVRQAAYDRWNAK